MSRDHFEHTVAFRIVPILLIVVLPLLGAIYIGQRQDAQARHRQDVASCERGNIVRERQRQVLLLAESAYLHLAGHLAKGDDAAAAEGLLVDAAKAKELALSVELVDCEALE
jgi:hypothetical protein